MQDFLYMVPAFLIGLAILIGVHEFGHFWVAKTLGIKIERFSIGFGKPIYSRHFGPDNTEFVLAAIPLGGYVKMLDERDEDFIAEEERHRAFNRQSIATRAAVLAAGPGFNFLFAIAAFVLLLGLGESGLRPQIAEVAPQSVVAQAGMQAGDEIVEVDGKKTPSWERAVMALIAQSVDGETFEMVVRGSEGRERVLQMQLDGFDELTANAEVLKNLGIEQRRVFIPAMAGEVTKGGAADKAGLLKGDLVLAIDDVPIKDWESMVLTIMANAGKTLKLSIERDGRTQTLSITPVSTRLENGKVVGRIGVARTPVELPEDMQVLVREPPWVAIGSAVQRTWDLSALTLKVLGKIVTGQASLKQNIAGPITIATTAGRTAQLGYERYINFLALLSVSLGVLNLLPIPVLDGGHLFLLGVEAIRRKPLTEIAEGIIQRIGLMLLLGIMALVLYVDLHRAIFGA